MLLERVSYLDAQTGGLGGLTIKMRPGIIIRRLLESLSGGILDKELAHLVDPSTIPESLPFREARALPPALLLDDTTHEARESMTRTSQLCLRMVMLKLIYKVSIIY